ncbi:MAG: CRISPR-associated helicase Cas3' [Endomicrobium sp.]|jgi:CRISPR-associated endonuclease/helicase Cas3|nr:CRISPR-associated helicase Cas3' [Endomicrobium sp.]
MSEQNYYAHYSTDRKRKQLLKCHLKEVACLTSFNAAKIGLGKFGYCLGLIHDLGKYSKEFQNYIEKNDKSQKGKIPHAKAGARIIYREIDDTDKNSRFLKELLELCCMSHHTNLIDMLDLDGENNFCKSLCKEIPIFEENIETDIKSELDNLDIKEIQEELKEVIDKIKKEKESVPKHFYLGMLAKFLLSCLIDADHTNSADFELSEEAVCRQNNNYATWEYISGKLENHLKGLNGKNDSSERLRCIRKRISDDCLKAGESFEKGCYKLEVPTGGGKTLSSFRFAVEMAKRHKMERIIYCIPYTTIIEQNAEKIRKIVEDDKKYKWKIVLEHHSNLLQKEKDENDEEINLNEILTQNWDAPVVFTTNVRILETIFGGRTTDTRRLHQLANSVIIFDEIQTLPIKCVHIFNNAINFLVDICGATVVLCTATQPLLDEVCQAKGVLKLSRKSIIKENVDNLFEELNRVKIKPQLDSCKDTGFIANKAIELANENDNCLVVCNTTKSAKEIFENIEKDKNISVYHLSAKMCPAHRHVVLEQIFNELNRQRGSKSSKKLIVVSTQVIEAGVDIDFNCGIRALAGLDSIIQTAGRINRNELSKQSNCLYIYEFDENSKNKKYMEEIEEGKEKSKRIFDEYKVEKIIPNIVKKYYKYYFFDREYKGTMDYKFEEEAKNLSLLNILSENKICIDEYKRTHHAKNPCLCMKQSFKKASKEFKVIGKVAVSVVTPYSNGQNIINQLCSEKYDFKKIKCLLKESQRYSVNIYFKSLKELYKAGAIKPINDKMGIFYLEPCYYDEKVGLTGESMIEEGGVVI